MHTAPAQQEFASFRPVRTVVYGPFLLKLAATPDYLPLYHAPFSLSPLT